MSTPRPKSGGRPRRRAVYAPVTFSEEAGVRFLHFGTEWIQGAMRLSKPDTIELEYARQMMAWTLFLDAPTRIAQLGLGTATLTRFCLRHFPQAEVVAVELNPSVVVAARVMFNMPPEDARFTIHVGDADPWVRNPKHRAAFDVLQVDLYDALARGPVLDATDFYAACRGCLRSPGILIVNLFGQHASFGRNMRNLETAFDGRVIALPEVHDGNRIAIAFNGPPLDVSWSALRERATVVARRLKLPASMWVDGLHAIASAQAVDTSFRI